MKKKAVIIMSIFIGIFLLIGLLCLYYHFFHKKEINHDVVFTLNEPSLQTIEIGSEYEELGCTVTCDGSDVTNKLKINTDNIDIKKIGNYKVKYYVVIDEKEYNYYRDIKVVDTTIPEIKLNGNEEINILVGETYEELGATATDNYDGDITNSIKIDGSVETSKEGEYSITYTVTDSSNNTNTIKRTVNVKKPKQVVIVNNNENKEVSKKKDPITYSNTITKNKFISNGIYIEGYKKDNSGVYKLLLEGDNNYSFDLTSNGDSKYKGEIDLTGVENGTYNLYIESGSKEELLNKMDFIDKIVRSKVGSKIIIFNYNEDKVSISVEDFYYQYDVLIDPGHGGSDTGASNEYIYEKDMNLIVSNYEKCRFESHGYKVYMTRNDDSYGSGMGNNDLKRLTRRAYEIGYVGAISKIVYSNHHNAIGNNYYSGYEVLLPGYLTSGDLANEFNIINKFNNIYNLKETHMRFYARDYDTEKKYSKLNGDVYYFKDNYAVNRIPYQLFNVKSIIYEGCYLTNKEDFNWYWNEKNWIKVSEAKLEVYINYLGGTYNSDNTSCI